MARSKLSTFVIDCRTDDLDAAAAFWSAALGRRVKAHEDDRYRDLSAALSEPILMVQRVDHESRIHLDIEADDIDAEVARLEKLGAKRLEKIRTWTVMQAPTGQRFCVVRVQRPEPGFVPASAHTLLATLVGHYSGETKTWLDPKAAPDVSAGELSIASLAGGRWLRFEERGSIAGKDRTAELLLGFHKDADRFEACLVDSFHTGTAMLWSHGARRSDGVIAVTGSYAAGEQTWGWRTEIRAGAALVIRAYNISPSGEEALAIETEWRR